MGRRSPLLVGARWMPARRDQPRGAALGEYLHYLARRRSGRFRIAASLQAAQRQFGGAISQQGLGQMGGQRVSGRNREQAGQGRVSLRRKGTGLAGAGGGKDRSGRGWKAPADRATGTPGGFNCPRL